MNRLLEAMPMWLREDAAALRRKALKAEHAFTTDELSARAAQVARAYYAAAERLEAAATEMRDQDWGGGEP